EKVADRREELLWFLQRGAMAAIGNLPQRRAPDTGGQLASQLGRSRGVERPDDYQGRIRDPGEERPQIDRGEGAASRGEMRGIGPEQDFPALAHRFRMALEIFRREDALH